MDMFTAMHNGLVQMGVPLWLANLVPPLVKSLILLLFILLNCMFLIWMERKVAGHMQRRMGPMRTGPHGIIQSLADVIKLISKEDIIPAASTGGCLSLAPIVAFVATLRYLWSSPLAPTLIAQDLNIALIYSWPSTPSCHLVSHGRLEFQQQVVALGAMRSAAQLMSYEVPLVIS